MFTKYEAALAVLSVALLTSVTSADTLVMDVDVNVTSGVGVPTGDPGAPWARATFTDVGTNNVSLKMESLNLSSLDFIEAWCFNDNYSAGISATPTGGPSSPPPGAGMGSAGDFDLCFNFGTAFPGNAAPSTWTLSGLPFLPLSAGNFNVQNANGYTTAIKLSVPVLETRKILWLAGTEASPTSPGAGGLATAEAPAGFVDTWGATAIAGTSLLLIGIPRRRRVRYRSRMR